MNKSWLRVPQNVITAILGLYVVSCLFLALISCKSSPTEPETPPSSMFYDITGVTVNIFDDSEAGGAVILNGERKDSGGTFKIENGNINSLFVEVPGFNPNYIFCQSETGETVATKDRNGLNSTAVTEDITLYMKLIPSDFDTTLLEKCIGGDIWNHSPKIHGDGTVQRFEGDTIIVGITEGESGIKPTEECRQNLRNAVKQVNDAAQGIVLLQYQDSDTGGDGLLYIVDHYISPVYGAYIVGDTIVRSAFYINIHATAKMVLEGVVRSMGFRRNGGSDNFPFLSLNPTSPAFINDGERALQLLYLLPPGFRL